MKDKILTFLFEKPILFLLVIFILIMLAIQLILAQQLSTQGPKLSKILTEIEQSKIDNRNLRVQIYQKGSISQLVELAKDYGFGEPKKFFFIKQNFLVAQNQ